MTIHSCSVTPIFQVFSKQDQKSMPIIIELESDLQIYVSFKTKTKTVWARQRKKELRAGSST